MICLNVSKISCLVGSRFQRRLSEVYTVRSTYHQQFYLRIAANFYGYKKAIKQHILRLYNKPLFTIMKMACAACVLVQKKIVHLHMKMNQFRQWLEQFLATRFANTTSWKLGQQHNLLTPHMWTWECKFNFFFFGGWCYWQWTFFSVETNDWF